MNDKVYQAETELENARELRNWKELTEKLAKYASKFPDRETVEALYGAERVFDTKKDFTAAQDMISKVLSKNSKCVEAHVLLAMMHNEKNNSKEALEELEALDTVTDPSAAAISSRRVLRFIVDGLRLRAELFQKQGQINLAFAANCAVIDVCERSFGVLPAGCTSKKINSCIDRSLRKIGETVTSEEDASKATIAYRKCLMVPLSSTLTQTIRLKALRLLFALDMDSNAQSGWPAYTKDQITRAGTTNTFVPASSAEEAALVHSILQHETSSVTQDLDDPLALVLSVERQSNALVWLLEKNIAGIPDESPSWAQLAYALDAAGRSEDALCICDQCLFCCPDDLGVLLFACLLCLNKLNDNRKAITYATTAIEVTKNKEGSQTETTTTTTTGESSVSTAIPNKFWKSRFNLCAGVAAQKLALEAPLHADRVHWQAEAFAYLQHALEENPKCPLANHFMALQFAEMREIDTALLFERRALTLDPRSPEGWNALALLYSAKQWTLPAIAAVDAGLRSFPQNSNLLMTKASLKLGVGAANDSLECCVRAAKRAKDVSVKIAKNADPSASIGRSVELPTEMCLTLSKAFQMLGKWEDAKACLVEQVESSTERDKQSLAALLSASATLLMKSGAQNATEEAQSYVDRALAVCPTNIDALLKCAQLAASAEHVVLEETSIASVLASYPLSHSAWKAMGLILHKKEMNDYAEECLLAAARLEATKPVRPFALCSRTLRFTQPY